jgi:hypothetical protein
MPQRVTIIQGHPDPGDKRLCRAFADCLPNKLGGVSDQVTRSRFMASQSWATAAATGMERGLRNSSNNGSATMMIIIISLKLSI